MDNHLGGGEQDLNNISFIICTLHCVSIFSLKKKTRGKLHLLQRDSFKEACVLKLRFTLTHLEYLM